MCDSAIMLLQAVYEEIIVVHLCSVLGILDRNNLDVNRCCWFSLRHSLLLMEREGETKS